MLRFYGNKMKIVEAEDEALFRVKSVDSRLFYFHFFFRAFRFLFSIAFALSSFLFRCENAMRYIDIDSVNHRCH